MGVASSYNYANAVTKFSNEACILIVHYGLRELHALFSEGVYKPLPVRNYKGNSVPTQAVEYIACWNVYTNACLNSPVTESSLLAMNKSSYNAFYKL